MKLNGFQGATRELGLKNVLRNSCTRCLNSGSCDLRDDLKSAIKQRMNYQNPALRFTDNGIYV